jgi:hypothetical protein
LFVALSPMLSDYYPTWNTGTAAQRVKKASKTWTLTSDDLVAIQAARVAAGDTHVGLWASPLQDALGLLCGPAGERLCDALTYLVGCVQRIQLTE